MGRESKDALQPFIVFGLEFAPEEEPQHEAVHKGVAEWQRKRGEYKRHKRSLLWEGGRTRREELSACSPVGRRA